MRLVLDRQSAYEYWMSTLSGGGARCLMVPNPQLTSFETFAYRELAQRMRRSGGIPGKLHLLTKEAVDRRQGAMLSCSSWGKASLPPRSIYEIGDGLYVVSPELCIVRLATVLPELEFLHATAGLMGAFSLSALERRNLVQREPLVTKEGMRSYLSHCTYVRGARLASRAVGWAVERSASPREASVNLALSLPSHVGGQSLGPFLANMQVSITAATRPLTQKSFLIADVAWSDKDLFLEYNSDTYHDDEEQKEFDFEKITAFQRMGKTVIPLSTRQFNNYAAFASVCQGIRKSLGRRDRGGAAYETIRQKTHARLLAIERASRNQPDLVETARWQTLMPYLHGPEDL